MKKILLIGWGKLVELNQVALLILAIILIFVPTTRTQELRDIFQTVVTVESFVIVSRAFRLGYGKKSPDELVEHFNKGAQRVTKTTLERLSICSAMIATVVLMFT